MISIATNHLWQSTLFAIVAGLVTLILRNNGAHIRYWIWMAASIKFLIPFSLLVTLGAQFAWRESPNDVLPTQVPEQLSNIMESIAQPIATSDSDFAPIAAYPSKNSFDTEKVLLMVWLCGSMFLLLYWVIRWKKLRAILRVAKIVRDKSIHDHAIAMRVSPIPVEPGIVGIFRPLLLMPAGLDKRLTPSQMQAILTHETCHLRRCDNLTAAIHMFVETLFWFHPLVWWIGARLAEERERACDEAVLSSGHHPQDYAEGILNVCQFYVTSQLYCAVGTSGAALKRRVRAIMLNRVGLPMPLIKSIMLAVLTLVAVASPMIAGYFSSEAASAQAPTHSRTIDGNPSTSNRPKFASASITLSQVDSPVSFLHVDPNGAFGMRNGSLRKLIAFAYDLQESEIQSPNKLLLSRYNIVAQAEEVQPSGSAVAIEQFRLMVRRLLKERFKLSFRRETRRVPVFILSREAGYLPIKAAKAGDPGPFLERGVNSITGHAIPMKLLANFLSKQLQRPIVDQSGLTKTYNFTLKWGPELGEPGAPQVTEMSSPPKDPSNTLLIETLQQQLALDLVSQNADVQHMIISQLRSPSDLMPPRVEKRIDPRVFDRYVGHYKLPHGGIMTVSRDGDKLLTRVNRLPLVQIFAESEREYFTKVIDSQISFVVNADGWATKLVLHQNGKDFPASRMNNTVAQDQLNALDKRINDKIAAPGTEAALRKAFEYAQRGEPNYDQMTAGVADWARKRWLREKDKFYELGELKSIRFTAVGPGGADIYAVQFDNGLLEWRIILDARGKIDWLNYRRLASP